jgi:membrane-associated phospholipid phosphatase
MKQKYLLFILLIILSSSSLVAQYKYTFSQFFDETLDFIKQPTKWDGNDYANMGLIGIGTGLTMFVDQPIRNAVLRDQRYFYTVPIVFGRLWGDIPAPIVFFSSFAVYSLITDDIWSRKVAYEIGQASLYAGGFILILKMTIGRARPFMEEGIASYHPFTRIIYEDYHSLPGGHTTAACVLSTVISRNVKPVWLKVLCYVPAALTFVSRVYQDKHWTSDNVMGAAIGCYIGTWVVDQHEKPVKADIKETGQNILERIQVQPIFTGYSYGLNLCLPLN